MPFMKALPTATEGLLLLLALPRWLLFLTKWGRRAICGNYEMEVSHLNSIPPMALTSNSDYRNTCWK